MLRLFLIESICFGIPAKYLSHLSKLKPHFEGAFCFVGGPRGPYFVKKTDSLPFADREDVKGLCGEGNEAE